jgi:hypothetical protein
MHAANRACCFRAKLCGCGPWHWQQFHQVQRRALHKRPDATKNKELSLKIKLFFNTNYLFSTESGRQKISTQNKR